MSFHARDFKAAKPSRDRADRGRCAYHAGLAAETQVAARYIANGYALRDERWRAGRGELDLVFDGPDGIVFVEVKKSKSFDAALSHLSQAQARRIFSTAELYLGGLPQGALTPSRIDVALVDATGNIDIHENFFAAGF